MTYAKSLAGLALIAVTALVVPAHAGNLVVNGNFATITGYGGGYANAPNFFLADRTDPRGLYDWTAYADGADYSNNIVYNTNTAAIPTRFDGVQFGFYSGVVDPADGSNFVALDGDSNNGVTPFQQTIVGLIVGDKYTVSFDWAATQYDFINGGGYGCPGCWNGPTTEQFEVSLGGTGCGNQTFFTSVDNTPAEGFTPWQNQKFTYTATCSSEVLSFLSIGTPTGLPPVALLADVSLQAVPEPATLALFGGGLLALAGFAVLRRRKSTVV